MKEKQYQNIENMTLDIDMIHVSILINFLGIITQN